MTTAAPPFHHEALFYDDDEAFLAATVPFVRGGLEADEGILVAVERSKAELLEGTLGADAARIDFAEMEELGRNPACIIPAWRDFVDTQIEAGRAMRGIGEPIWPGRSAAEVDEGRRHESLLNLAFDGKPSWSLLCPYDSGALDDDILDTALLSHPWVTRDGVRGESVAWDLDDLGSSPFAGVLPPPPVIAESLDFGQDQLGEVRGMIARQASYARLRAGRIADLVNAAGELAANSVLHGGGRGTARVWRERDALVAEVEDLGRIEEPLTGRLRPAVEQSGGRGLWMVNHLCDLVQIRSGTDGTTVRVRFELN